MPAAACPAIVQRYSYRPFALKLTVRVTRLPGRSFLLPFPLHVVASTWRAGFVHTLKSCSSAPLLTIVKTTFPCFTVFFDNVKRNSDGFAAVTVTRVVAVRAAVASATAADAIPSI